MQQMASSHKEMKTYINESAWMKESLNPNTMLEIKNLNVKKAIKKA